MPRRPRLERLFDERLFDEHPFDERLFGCSLQLSVGPEPGIYVSD
jgi:hypothetical protein